MQVLLPGHHKTRALVRRDDCRRSVHQPSPHKPIQPYLGKGEVEEGLIKSVCPYPRCLLVRAGHLAAGSRKGEIRLFDSSLRMRAKTQLPGFGGLLAHMLNPSTPSTRLAPPASASAVRFAAVSERFSPLFWPTDPIIGIDVTHDGRWILATTQTYLILSNTELPSLWSSIALE